MDVVYPTLGDVLAIHRKELEASGGADGVRDQEGVEAALDRMKQTLFGDDAYPSIPAKAAAFFQTIIQRHPFVDGNKRTAVRVTYTFLETNGRRVTATNEATVELARGVASGDYEIDEITDWFRVQTDPEH